MLCSNTLIFLHFFAPKHATAITDQTHFHHLFGSVCVWITLCTFPVERYPNSLTIVNHARYTPYRSTFLSIKFLDEISKFRLISGIFGGDVIAKGYLIFCIPLLFVSHSFRNSSRHQRAS